MWIYIANTESKRSDGNRLVIGYSDCTGIGIAEILLNVLEVEPLGHGVPFIVIVVFENGLEIIRKLSRQGIRLLFVFGGGVRGARSQNVVIDECQE